MKKLILLFLITCSVNSYSQTSNYIPFADTNAIWIYKYYDDLGGPDNIYRNYQLSGDTIIANSTYKKIYSPAWTLSDENYNGAIREVDKIIYYIPDTSTVEYVLYNFNMTVGDTIIHPFGGAVCSDDTVFVDYIDSILIADNYHKRFWFSSESMWIEGIGSNFYLFQPYNVFCDSGNYQIYCMLNDAWILMDEGSSSCFNSVEEIKIPQNEISIFPNPSNSNFTVSLKNGVIKEIRVQDISGRNLIYQKDINQTTLTIDKMPAGTYILKLYDDKGRLSIQKIISSP